MANPLPEEKEFYQRIKDENIQVPLGVWDLIYHRIGDALSAINLACEYYHQHNESMPIEEAKKLLNYTRLIKLVINRLTKKSAQPDPNFPEFKEEPELHPIILDMLTHYIPNDVHAINLIITDSIDPIDPKPPPVEYLKKILGYTKSSKAFMERLREATLKQANF
jgi:hypothetical protein